MRYEFATLFDKRYLARGLVLYRSLEKHCRSFRLFVFCADQETQAALRALRLDNVALVQLAELESAYQELARVRPTRSLTEYYWTATPATCLFVLERHPEVSMVTHLDADLMFYADPAPLYRELADDSILLTPHRVSPEFRDSTEEERQLLGGRFNVQFEVFRRDENGLKALRWWHERCVEWCYDRFEPGRYGDQGYLDDWETRFPGVRALQHPGAGVAPWNVSRYVLAVRDHAPEVDGSPVIFHHFASLQLHRATAGARALARVSRAYRMTDGPVPVVWTAGWRLSDAHFEDLWTPYVERLSTAYGELSKLPGRSFRVEPLRPHTAAFHVMRRWVPPRIRDRYWRVRYALWLRRTPRADVNRGRAQLRR